jgi:hypothetical protein
MMGHDDKSDSVTFSKPVNSRRAKVTTGHEHGLGAISGAAWPVDRSL